MKKPRVDCSKYPHNFHINPKICETTVNLNDDELLI